MYKVTIERVGNPGEKYLVTLTDSNGVTKSITVPAELVTQVFEELNKLDGKGVYR